MGIGPKALAMIAGQSRQGTEASRKMLTWTPSLALPAIGTSVGTSTPNPNVFATIPSSVGETTSPTDKVGYDTALLLSWLLPTLYSFVASS